MIKGSQPDDDLTMAEDGWGGKEGGGDRRKRANEKAVVLSSVRDWGH